MNTSERLARVEAELRGIRRRCRQAEVRYAAELANVRPEYRRGARNFVHYLALRESDIRELQDELTALGLSSLDRVERNVLGSLEAVQSAIAAMSSSAASTADADDDVLDLRNPDAGVHGEAIFGRVPEGRDVGIMVTLPREAADDESLVRGMLDAGMSVARINCAHDDETVWTDMIRNLRKACDETHTACRLVMDLAGPKIRTGDLEPGPRVFHVRPRRDPMGRTIAPRRVRFIPDDTLWRGTKSAVIPVSRDVIEYAHVGDEVRCKDTRGKKRVFKVVGKDQKGLVLEIYKGTYLQSGCKLRLVRKQEGETITGRIGDLPAVERPLLLRPGDTLNLDREPVPGAPAVMEADGNVVEPAHIACRQPDVFDFVSVGDRVLLNDGKIAGVAESIDDARLVVRIIKAKPTGSRLRGDRGINFPDSDIRLPGLTASDREHLEFIVRHADAVSLSFVRRPDDILLLMRALSDLDAGDLGLVVKIETREGFHNLPQLLLTAMQRYPIAVMIARGDLAVEAGWERLAELQEELLWLCEAAHVPVVWATQVLERTAKKGQPSRAEVSDAALSQRADCVMLNKGPHILGAIRMLDDILRRMRGHQYKKSPRMRPLTFSAD